MRPGQLEAGTRRPRWPILRRHRSARPRLRPPCHARASAWVTRGRGRGRDQRRVRRADGRGAPSFLPWDVGKTGTNATATATSRPRPPRGDTYGGAGLSRASSCPGSVAPAGTPVCSVGASIREPRSLSGGWKRRHLGHRSTVSISSSAWGQRGGYQSYVAGRVIHRRIETDASIFLSFLPFLSDSLLGGFIWGWLIAGTGSNRSADGGWAVWGEGDVCNCAPCSLRWGIGGVTARALLICRRSSICLAGNATTLKSQWLMSHDSCSVAEGPRNPAIISAKHENKK
jgi:hypothetical protein